MIIMAFFAACVSIADWVAQCSIHTLVGNSPTFHHHHFYSIYKPFLACESNSTYL
jgi:hypothetical protein